MKVCLRNISKNNLSDSVDVIKDFCQLLQSELKLKGEIHINFMIFVLCKGRLLIDVFRTLAHEWVHEYQHQSMGVRDDQPIQDIGGPEENMASILSSVFLKKFQKQFPKHMKKLFEE